MTDDGVYVEIDCSKTYSQGQAFQVVAGNLMSYEIKFKETGKVPSDLSGQYTSVDRARNAIKAYISGRDAHFELVARKRESDKTLKRKQPKQEVITED